MWRSGRALGSLGQGLVDDPQVVIHVLVIQKVAEASRLYLPPLLSRTVPEIREGGKEMGKEVKVIFTCCNRFRYFPAR